MAKAYATPRRPRHQARAIQISVLTGWRVYRSRIVFTMEVTGWFSAKARTGPGMVSASFDAELTGLPPEDATIAASISEKPDSRAQAAFERAAAWKGQQIESVAYTLQVHKTHLEDIKDVGQATVSMSIAPSWALNRGGITNMKIARYADDGSSQLLDTQFTGLDSSQNMVFVGTSSGGLSIFALVAVKNSQVAIAPLPSRPIFPSGEGTAPLAILPPLLLFVALTVIRRQS